jgi:hypothetical protein
MLYVNIMTYKYLFHFYLNHFLIAGETKLFTDLHRWASLFSPF